VISNITPTASQPMGVLNRLFPYIFQYPGMHDGGGLYTTNHMIGTVAPFLEDSVSTAVECAIAFASNESGANSTNYTQVEFRVGPIVGYSVLATLDTQTNPLAGVAVKQTIYRHLEPGDLLWVYATRVGTASVNFNAIQCVYTISVAGERII